MKANNIVEVEPSWFNYARNVWGKCWQTGISRHEVQLNKLLREVAVLRLKIAFMKNESKKI